MLFPLVLKEIHVRALRWVTLVLGFPKQGIALRQKVSCIFHHIVALDKPP